jgi:hypothetical protein
MSGARARRLVSRLALGGLLALATAAGSESADGRGQAALKGACYCRAAGELACVGEVTESDCKRRCTEALCDDWFWLERRPCWNWGYGG